MCLYLLLDFVILRSKPGSCGASPGKHTSTEPRLPTEWRDFQLYFTLWVLCCVKCNLHIYYCSNELVVWIQIILTERSLPPRQSPLPAGSSVKEEKITGQIRVNSEYWYYSEDVLWRQQWRWLHCRIKLLFLPFWDQYLCKNWERPNWLSHQSTFPLFFRQLRLSDTNFGFWG